MQRDSRSSSTWSTTTPARAVRNGPALCFRGLRRRLVLPHRRVGPLRRRHRLRQHAERVRPAGAAADHGLAALLGDRDARRRLPLRPGLGPGAQRAARRPARAVPDRDAPGPGAARRQADRRAVGRDRRGLPGRSVPAAVVRVERPVPRLRSGTSGVATATAYATSRRGCPGRATCTPTTGGCRSRRSTSSPRTTASRCATWCRYNRKHNEANGEDNRDGTDNNRSWNCGVEGETDDEAVVALRRRQAANLLATLLLSTGVPMITAGDERGRTQGGNNNAFCQDNEIVVVPVGGPRQGLGSTSTGSPGRCCGCAPSTRCCGSVTSSPGTPDGDDGRKDITWLQADGTR